ALYPPLVALLAFFSWLLGTAGLDGPRAPPASLVARSPAELGLAAVLVVVVAWAEETIFRGYLLARLRTVTGSTTLAVVLSALLFALGHTYSGPAGVAGVTLLAIVFSLVYLWRRSLVAPIVLHFLQDFLALVILPWLRPS